MTLKPFTCIHCGAETQNFAIIHFKYDQAMYDHMYGVNHPKGYREVDAGEGAVFVCDDCIKKMRVFRRHYISRIILSVLTALVSVLAIRINGGLWMCAAPFAGVFVLMVIRHGEYMERSRRQHHNNVASYGWTKQAAIASDEMSAVSGLEFIMGLVMVVVFILGFFAKGILLKIVAIALIVISGITFLGSLIGFLASKARPTPNDWEAAARYYIYYDENILLKDYR